MKLLKSFRLLFLIIFSAGTLAAQTLLQSSTFDDESISGWTLENATSEWRWTPDGKADLGDGLWNNRPAIKSKSRGGAIRFANTQGSSGRIVSPVYNFTDQASIFIRFNQYYRNFESITALQVTNLSTGAIMNFPLNQNVRRHIETGANDVQIINISEAITSGGDVQIAFLFEGNRYFWIIDDVEIWDQSPPPPTTNPTRYGEKLTEYDYSFGVHRPENTQEEGQIAWPYVPDQILVQFKTDTPESERQLIRDTFGVVFIESCVCDTLELWHLGDNIIVDQNGDPVPGGGSIGIQERVIGACTNSEIDAADFNYYATGQFEDAPTPPFITPINEADITPIANAPEEAVRIAVIDTGVDYLHPDHQLGLTGFMYRKRDTECYENDPIGWNFVQDLNNPMDDHSHGTHVAGIIAENIRNTGPHDCKFHIIPYKTHDAHGIATLFDVSCATYLTIRDHVNIINDSWGFYGIASPVLKNAISAALDENILIVSSAGNDGLLLDTLNQFPACYALNNRLTVGSYGGEEDLPVHSGFSNFSNIWVDILAPGENIKSTVPVFYDPSGYSLKSGTSMSTPAGTAAAAIAFCQEPDYVYAKNKLLDCAATYPALNTFVMNGRVLKMDVNCLTTGLEEIPESAVRAFDIYPNPTDGILSLVAKESFEQLKISVLSLEGKELMQYKIDNWYQGQEQSLNLAALPSGMYFLHIHDGEKSWVSRIAKL